MDTILNSAKDLIKFKAISYINTGDKTQDNLINMFLVSLITVIFAFINIDKLRLYWIFYVSKNNNETINSFTKSYYQNIYKNLDIKRMTWSLKKYAEFADQVASYYLRLYNTSSFYDIKTDTFTMYDKSDYSLFNRMKNCLKKDPCLIYIKNNKPVYIVKADESIYIDYTDFSVVQEFIKIIKNEKTYKEDVKTESCELSIKKYIDNNLSTINTIYKNHTFDTYVSKYKNIIIDYIESFKKSNSDISKFGGFGTYNLGLMIYGEPGSGKTVLIKAIANKLNRNIIMVDMRTIKTRKQFQNLFDNCENYVYCLDEFDCIQGAIKNRTDEKEEHIDPNIELKERYLKVLELVSKQDKEKTLLTEELENIKKQMKTNEDSLTLDSILTVLDGPVEMRNRVIIATTNYIDRIDPALLRHGRFDLKIKLEKFNEAEMKELLYLMFKDTSSEEELKRLSESHFKEYTYTPVELIAFASSIGNLKNVLDKLK